MLEVAVLPNLVLLKSGMGDFGSREIVPDTEEEYLVQVCSSCVFKVSFILYQVSCISCVMFEDGILENFVKSGS